MELTDGGVSNLWQTCLTRIADDAQVLASYTGAGALTWELEGMAAIVSHDYGAGHTWYVGCDLRRQDITHLICEQLVPCLGIELGNWASSPSIAPMACMYSVADSTAAGMT